MSYNSQNWRKDGSTTWKLGRDVGYGFGWKLLAGSLTPYFGPGRWTVHHYLFTDSSGAEYRLDVNTNGVWTSREGIYVEYDANQNRLYFPDGSFWVMGATAAGTEADAGARYPTVIQDSNGNQILVRYGAGAGIWWVDSSARISQIEDVRAVPDPYNQSVRRTYTFTYSVGETVPHLQSIQNHIGTAENYTLTYVTNQPLYSPFSPQVYWCTSGR